MSFKLGNITVSDTVCISLVSNENERESVLSECKKFGIVPKFHLPTRNKDPVRGCLESHLYCIRYAQKNKLENILILEDDVRFGNYESLESIVIPEDYKMIYLGYNGLEGYLYSPGILKLTSTLTTHAYILHSSMYQYVIDNIESDWSSLEHYNNLTANEKPFFVKNMRAIDLFYSKWICQQFDKSYGLFPILAYQKAGYSTTENNTVDYSESFNTRASILLEHKMARYICSYIPLPNETTQDIIKRYCNLETIQPFDYLLVHTENGTILEFPKSELYHSNSWDIYYYSDDCYLLRLTWNSRSDNNQMFAYPRIDKKFPTAYHSNTIVKKPILCVYVPSFLHVNLESRKNIYEMINGDMRDFDIYICSEQNTSPKNFKDITLYHSPLKYLSKAQYEFLPRHELLLVNDVTFFIDQPMDRAYKIHMYISTPKLHSSWQGLPAPFSGSSILYNMRNRIDSIVFPSESILQKFKGNYGILSKGLFVRETNSNLPKKFKNSLACDYHDPERELYLQWHKELPHSVLYICNSKNTVKSESLVYKTNGDYSKYQIIFCQDTDSDTIEEYHSKGIITVGNDSHCIINSQNQDCLVVLKNLYNDPTRIDQICKFLYQKHKGLLFAENIRS